MRSLMFNVFFGVHINNLVNKTLNFRRFEIPRRSSDIVIVHTVSHGGYRIKWLVGWLGFTLEISKELCVEYHIDLLHTNSICPWPIGTGIFTIQTMATFLFIHPNTEHLSCNLLRLYSDALSKMAIFCSISKEDIFKTDAPHCNCFAKTYKLHLITKSMV